MDQRTTQRIVLDSCVVIDLLKKPSAVRRLKSDLCGRPVTIILCDTVLGEVRRVCGFEPGAVIRSISRLLKKRIETVRTTGQQRLAARQISGQYAICHNGDNLILGLCKIRTFVLVTLDRALLKACEFVGVAGFRPGRMGGL